MKRIIPYLILCCVIANCDHHVDNLCEIDANVQIREFGGLQVYTSLEAGLSCAKDRRQPVLLLFSCFACVGDTRYEERLFIEEPNRSIIAKNYVPVVLYVDDRTKLPSERDTVIIDGKEKVISDLGEKNALYQMQKFKANTQPLLYILDHFGDEITAPIGYQPKSSGYTAFLKAGMKQYTHPLEKNYTDINIEEIDTNDYLIRVPNENYELGMPFKFINKNNETVIAENEYYGTYTDTLKTIAIVYQGRDLIAINRKGENVFDVFQYDNGPDYLQEGLFRVRRNGKIGYADEMGRIVIPCKFKCAYPFSDGAAKVSEECEESGDSEHSYWESEEWYFIDKNGRRINK